MEHPNPFIYGKVVTGENFADRIDLLKIISLEATNGQNMVIFGPRRIGKSSLLKQMLSNVVKEHNIPTIYIDLLKYDKIELITGQIFEQLEGNLEKGIKLARSVIKGLIVKLSDSFAEISHLSSDDLLIKTFDFLEKRSQKDKKMIVVFDEFQELEIIDKKKIKLIRSCIQNHLNISYIFTGSKQRLIELFTNSEEPFYNFGKIIQISKPDQKEMTNFIKTRFQKSGISVSEEISRIIVKKSNNLPYFSQIFAHEVWVYSKLLNKELITQELIESILTEIVENNTIGFESIWSNFTKNQRTALKILSETDSLFKSATLSKFKIAQGSLQTAITSLEEQHIIWKIKKKIEFLDPFFEIWVSLKWS